MIIHPSLGSIESETAVWMAMPIAASRAPRNSLVKKNGFVSTPVRALGAVEHDLFVR